MAVYYSYHPVAFVLVVAQSMLSDSNSVLMQGTLSRAQDDSIVFTGHLDTEKAYNPTPTLSLVGNGTYALRIFELDTESVVAAIRYQYLTNAVREVDLAFGYSI